MLQVLQDYGMLFLVGSWPHGPVGGLVTTLSLASLGLLGSMPLALALGVARTTKKKRFFWPSSVFVFGMRSIPLIMIVFWAYYLLPFLFGHSIPPFQTALFAIIFYEAAFLAEIVRAGLQGLPKGQVEAAKSVGLTDSQTLLYVTLPQALLNMLPSLVNQFISTIKATSIAYIIGVQDLSFAAQQINAAQFSNALHTYGIVALIFFFLCFSLSRLSLFIEKKVRRAAGN